MTYGHEYTIIHLRALCGRLHLPVSGTKSQLISRLDEEFCRKLQQQERSDGFASDEAEPAHTHNLPRQRRHPPAHARSDRPTPTQIQSRISRALSQRMFMIDRTKESRSRHLFRVLGSTGNVYTVVISTSPKCDCPDSSPVCKHIIFVLCRVLRVPHDSHLIGQTSISTQDLTTVLGQERGHCSADIQADKRVWDALSEGISPEIDPIRKPVKPDDDCPICYEPLANEMLVWCKSTCGNNMHNSCMTRWMSQAHGSAKCPLCRAVWISHERTDGRRTDGQYTNLSHLTGQPSLTSGQP